MYVGVHVFVHKYNPIVMKVKIIYYDFTRGYFDMFKNEGDRYILKGNEIYELLKS